VRDRYGPWALVTGASSGIGEALARECARAGLAVALVARREDRLRALSAELARAFGAESLAIAADLGEPAGIELVRAAVGARAIGLVCANAGFGEKGAFDAIPLDDHRRMIRLNCEATLATVHAFLPPMLARGRGGVLVVASTAAFQGVPLSAAYAATKAFDLSLAEGLAVELAPRGVDVVALCPGATDTEGPRRTGVDGAKVPFGFASPEEVARAGLSSLGRRTVALPRRVDRLSALSTRLVPRALAARLAGRTMAKVTGRG
jgi:short-subunit dehydrogenase